MLTNTLYIHAVHVKGLEYQSDGRYYYALRAGRYSEKMHIRSSTSEPVGSNSEYKQGSIIIPKQEGRSSCHTTRYG